MIFENKLEGKLFELERKLDIAKLNDWTFDIDLLKDEIREVERELEEEFKRATEE